MSRKFIPFMIVFTLAILACSLTATPQEIPTNTASADATATATSAPSIPSATPETTLAPSNTPMPTTASSDTPSPTVSNPIVPVPVPASNNYIDDRSTPSQVIVSLYNAIDRHEYLRAYHYWTDPATSLGDFNAYAAGYQSTSSVDLVFGQISGDAGMSQVYYTIPVILKATDKNGDHSVFAACYVVHEVSPDVFGAPPFQPMGIDRGSATPGTPNASDTSMLATACDGYPSGSNLPSPASGNPLDIEKSNFVDNRSGAIETLSSFLNALNRKQYVRAYSYYQNPATFPGPFSEFAAGYADTDVISVTFGNVQSEGAAGSMYYKVPLALHVQTTSNAEQTFVGCYTLRLTQPAVQGTPPFQPMGILSGKFNQVANGTAIAPLLPAACN
jgi:hypothetical protein